MSRSLTIGWLYPTALSTYGDRGNVQALLKRAQWRGLDARVLPIGADDPVPRDVDVFFIGGGQDRAQSSIADKLVRHQGPQLREQLSGGAALLAICGGYQLLCREYVPLSGEHIVGVGVFDATTRASGDRMVGNVTVSSQWGQLVGFENHSGRTYLAAGVAPMGRVEPGHGNNGTDGTEGAICGRSVGSYLHGALLPRNPALTDWLLREGLRRLEPTAELAELSDDWEMATHEHVRRRRDTRVGGR